MNKRHFFTIGITTSAILLAISGCHVPTIKADFKMPPRVISDIDGIDPMEIVVNVDLKGNKIAKGDDSIAKSAICKRIAAGFCNEKSYKTLDFVWGNKVGSNKMLTLLQSKKQQHGYSIIATETPKKLARLEITLKAQVDAHEKDINVDTNLKKVYYREKTIERKVYWYDKKGRRQSATVYEPTSEPARTERSVATSKVKETVVTATGKFSAQITDKDGKVVYKKLNNDLRFSATCNHKNLDAMPNNAEIFSLLAQNAVKDVIKDLSTYTETRELKINKDGNEKVFYLLESLAFAEVNGYAENVYFEIEEAKQKVEKDKVTFKDYKKYLSKTTQELTFADFENFAISYEVTGSRKKAKEFYEIALELKKENKGFFDYDVKIAEKGLARLNEPTKQGKKSEVKNIDGRYFSTSLQVYPQDTSSQSVINTATKTITQITQKAIAKPVSTIDKAKFRKTSKMINKKYPAKRSTINRARFQKQNLKKSKVEYIKQNKNQKLRNFY